MPRATVWRRPGIIFRGQISLITGVSQGTSENIENIVRTTALPIRRILGLTLLLGIAIGIWLALCAGLFYVLARFVPNALYPSSPLIYRLLGPLAGAVFGFISLLVRSLLRLLRHHHDFWVKRSDPSGGLSLPFACLSFGLLFIWMGGSQVILLCFALDPDMWGPVELAGMWVLVSALCVETIFYLISYVRKSLGREKPK